MSFTIGSLFDVMQGIADVMSEEKASRKKWLDDLLGDCL